VIISAIVISSIVEAQANNAKSYFESRRKPAAIQPTAQGGFSREGDLVVSIAFSIASGRDLRERAFRKPPR
jgi:hypothetical protein